MSRSVCIFHQNHRILLVLDRSGSDCKLPRHLGSLVFLIDDGRSFVEFVVTLAAHVKIHGTTVRYK